MSKKNKRVVIKIGTTLLTKKDFTLNKNLLKKLSEEIAKLRRKDFEVIIVSSGSVACGRSILKLKKENKNIPYRQALSAVGQSILMTEYSKIFKNRNIIVAQALLTNYDFSHKKNFIITANTIELLLKMGVVPIINENDVTTYAELKFGDNDMMAAKLSAMITADMLILLTDVDGLYNDDPSKKEAKLIPELKTVNKNLRKLAKESKSKHSMGGMTSKIDAAEYAISAGIKCVVANGKKIENLSRILIKDEKIGTLFLPKIGKKEKRKRWMQASTKKGCKLIVDDGARNALTKRGASLLPSGIIEVKGQFPKGEVVSVYSKNGILIAYGITNYTSTRIKEIKGLRSTEIAKIIKNVSYDEVIHRDHLVVV